MEWINRNSVISFEEAVELKKKNHNFLSPYYYGSTGILHKSKQLLSQKSLSEGCYLAPQSQMKVS